jgi:hypothetical protein
MASVIGQRWEVYNFDKIKEITPRRGEIVHVIDVPDYDKTIIQVIGDGDKTIDALIKETFVLTVAALLEKRIEAVENLGHYVGSFAAFTLLPNQASAFPQGITVNDFTTIRKDETNDGKRTRYVVIEINSGVITWELDFVYEDDIDDVPTQGSNLAVSSGGVFSWFGGALTSLLTTAKTVIGAINELFNTTVKTTGNQTIAGNKTFNARANFNNGLNISGGTSQAGILEMLGNRIVDMADPLNPADAANKGYVDLKTAGMSNTGTVEAGSGNDTTTPRIQSITIWDMIQRIWNRIFATNTALSQKQNNLNRTVGSNDNATGTIADQGGNISVPIQVTVTAGVSTATLPASGTAMTLRSWLTAIRNNVSHLFANKADNSITLLYVSNVRANHFGGTNVTFHLYVTAKPILDQQWLDIRLAAHAAGDNMTVTTARSTNIGLPNGIVYIGRTIAGDNRAQYFASGFAASSRVIVWGQRPLATAGNIIDVRLSDSQGGTGGAPQMYMMNVRVRGVISQAMINRMLNNAAMSGDQGAVVGEADTQTQWQANPIVLRN